MHRVTSLLLVVVFAGTCANAQTAVQPSLKSRLEEVLVRLSNGHSPTQEELTAAETIDPLPGAAAVHEALPALGLALDNHDRSMRTFALTVLLALQTQSLPLHQPEEPADAIDGSAAPRTTETGQAVSRPAPPGSASFKPEIARALAPAIGAVAARLTDERPANRLLAVEVLGGFRPDPPAAVYAPLLAYLKRDDGTGPTGAAVVGDLLGLGPISEETAQAISVYLRRSDQRVDARATLIDTIAAQQNQSLAINQTLLTYLNSDDNSVRARLILSLPQLDLASETFSDLRSRVSALAAMDPATGQENLQVINAARSVASCWVKVRLTQGCPLY